MLQGERLPRERLGRFGIALLHQCDRQVARGRQEGRIGLRRGAVMLYGLRKVAPRVQEGPEVIARPGMARVARDRVAVARDGALEVALRLQRNAELVKRLRVYGT